MYMRVRLTVLVAILSHIISSASIAGTIVLSGDTNIGNPIDASGGFSTNPGNSVFFRNILGNATNVLIHNEVSSTSSGAFALSAVNNLYNSIGGVSSTLNVTTTPISASLLSPIDLFIIRSIDAFSSSEISTLSSFLTRNKTLFIFGENSLNFSVSNAFINDALLTLGSTLRLGSNSLDGGFITTTNLNADAFTVGVGSISYGSTNTVAGGKSLVRTVNASGSQTFVAYERSPIIAVPEPLSFDIWWIGFATLFWSSRRQRFRGSFQVGTICLL